MEGQMTFEFAKRPTIKGYPELRWTGKRPYESTQYYPAQLRERYGEETNGWINKIFWGDNLQVMSHLLKEYRGKVQLIYIDPPFDSRVDYKMKVELKGKKATNDISTFEEKQYGDIWTNDEYLQFMYERIVIMKELLSDTGVLYIHCDWHKGHYIKCIMDELLKANLPYKTYEKRKAENPMQPVEKITIVCMGHEPDLKASLEQELSEYKLNIEIVDILRDKKDLQLKREAEAEIVKEGNKLVIRSFYPMNLMQKLSLQKEYVEDWRQLVESIMIDWNYDGVVMQPAVTDVPDKKKIVRGIYDIPEDAGTIRVKITDLLAESLEMEVE